jgi:hypothetical protein
LAEVHDAFVAEGGDRGGSSGRDGGWGRGSRSSDAPAKDDEIARSLRAIHKRTSSRAGVRSNSRRIGRVGQGYCGSRGSTDAPIQSTISQGTTKEVATRHSDLFDGE